MWIYLIGYMRSFGWVSRLFAIQEPADGENTADLLQGLLFVKPVKTTPEGDHKAPVWHSKITDGIPKVLVVGHEIEGSYFFR